MMQALHNIKQNFDDCVHGIAIDDERTKDHHQILQIVPDKNGYETTLRYAVFCPLLPKDPDIALPENFLRLMASQTPTDHEGMKEMDRAWQAWDKGMRRQNIRDYNEKIPTAFLRGKVCDAVTYDIKFADNYEVTDFNIRYNTGLMREAISLAQANERIRPPDVDADLRLAYDFCINYHKTCAPNITKSKENKDDLDNKDDQENTDDQDSVTQEKEYSAGIITNVVGRIVQSHGRKLAFREGIDCILRNNQPKSRDETGEYFSVSQALPAIGAARNAVRQAWLPATSSRDRLHYFNIRAIAGYIGSDGKNLFAPEITTACAQYHMHVQNYAHQQQIALRA